MATTPRQVIALLEALAQKTGYSLDYHGFGRMGEALEAFATDQAQASVSQRYLYENAWRAAHQAIEDGRKTLRLQLNKLDTIARYLEYDHFHQFVDTEQLAQLAPDSPSWDLSPYVGYWYSLVRDHSGQPDILISPVQMELDKGTLWVILRGPTRMFKGKAFVQNGCLCCQLRSEQNKHLHLIFRIGAILNPALLEGVFAAVSTPGNPISGREVLLRVPDVQALSQLGNYRVNMLTGVDFPPELPRDQLEILKQYFSLYQENIIKIPYPNTFTITDLDR